MMMRVETRKRKWAVLAAVSVSAALWLAGADLSLLRDAMRAVSGPGATKEAFAEEYGRLNAQDSQLGLLFAVFHPWLTSGESWDRTHTPSVAARRVVGPARNAGPVDTLAITSFSVSPTSLVFRVEWPPDFEIPWGWLHLLGTTDLPVDPDDWHYLRVLEDIEQEQGFAEREVLFEDLLWHGMEGIDVSARAFFKVRRDPLPDWWGLEEEEEDGDGDPPDFPQAVLGDDKVSLTGYIHSLFQPFVTYTNLTRTFDATPGELYLIAVHCNSVEAVNVMDGHTDVRDTIMAWDITAPDGQTLSGSADAYDVGTAWEESISLGLPGMDATMGFILFRAPEPPPGRPSGTATTSVSLSVTEGVRDPQAVHWVDPYASMVHVTQYHLTLHQGNFPNTHLPALGSTDFGGYAGRKIEEGGAAFITGIPAMPSLEARVGTTPELPSLSFETSWRLTVNTERPEYRTQLDDRAYPPNGAFTAYAPGGRIGLNTLMGNEFIGGSCTLDVKIRGRRTGETAEGRSFKFKIRGLNPEDGLAKAYINSVVDDAFKPYAWALMWHESEDGGYRYCQFNAQNNKLRGLPNRGYPDGWGIGQIDRSGDQPKGTTSTAEVYNWRVNVDAGAQVLNNKRAEYKGLLKKIQNEYPNEWVEPPATIVKHGITWTHEQWAVSVLYNGSKGVKTTTVWGKDKNGNNVNRNIQCPLRFDPKSPTRWTFEDNVRKYTQLVAPYLPPHAPPVAPE